MLAIRLKRTGRSGHSQFRVVVQDSHFHPSRGRVVAYLGNYDPHTKNVQIDKESAAKYLNNGAQPSDRVARLLQKEGVDLPKWVKLSEPKQRTTRNAEKLRRNRPANEPAPEAPVDAPAAAEEAADAPAPEASTDESAPAADEPAAEPIEEVAAEPEAEASAEQAEAPTEAPAEEPTEAPAEPEAPEQG